MIRIDGEVSWRVTRTKNNYWVAICDAMKLTVQGTTWAELQDIIDDTLTSILETLLREGQFERFLMDRGWHAVSPVPRADQVPDGVIFDLPWTTVREQHASA